MQMASSRFFVQLKYFLHISGLIPLLLAVVISAKADVGLTHQLKLERAQALEQINRLESDSVPHQKMTDSLKTAVILLDGQIMDSYDETVARMAAQKRQRGGYAQSIVIVALVTTLAAIFLTVLIGMARRRLVRSDSDCKGLRDLYLSLATDFVNSVSAEKASAKPLLRVNLVVIAGLIFMGISVIAFLLRTL